MKLVIKQVSMGDLDQFMLATEDGVILPKQRSAVIRDSINEATTITVEFVVDNNKVRFEHRGEERHRLQGQSGD